MHRLKVFFAVFSLCVCANALLVSKFPKTYKDTTLIQTRIGAGNGLVNLIMGPETLAEVSRRLDLKGEWGSLREAELTVADRAGFLKNSLAIRPIILTKLLRIEATAREAETATSIVTELTEVLREKISEGHPNWTIFGSPKNSLQASGPNLVFMWTLGLVASFGLGVLASRTEFAKNTLGLT